ncbi:MAG: MBL fold metallo-hydrolase [Candidatus Eremiobacteraeota bacterium]|nr:MBL fold metallo-hydrolase [Candidatus Eremiobacteraeota bacterium]
MEKIGDQLHVLKFPDLFNANCFLIETESLFIVVDTFMGPASMVPFLDYMKSRGGKRSLFIVNTHHHFDHVWGNCAFGDAAVVIAQEECLAMMRESAQATLDSYRKSSPDWEKGRVTIVLPGITFSRRLTISDGTVDVVLEHLPGHSRDSLVVFLEPSHVCLAGDMVEDPFPLAHEGGPGTSLDLFIRNLGRLRKWKPRQVFPGHGERTDPSLADDNREYLSRLRSIVKKLIKEGKEPEPLNVAVEECLGRKSVLSDFYREAHEGNVHAAAAQLSSPRGPA